MSELAGSPEDIRQKIDEAEKLFGELEKVDLPQGVNDKSGKAWEVKLESLAIKGAESSYPEEEMLYDETRVMSYDVALELLSDLENAIVFANVASPLATAGDAVLAEIENAQKILQGVWDIATKLLDLFKKGWSWEEVMRVLWSALTRFIVVWTASTMKKSAKMNLEIVKAAVEKARSRAFPQANKGRHLKRKRSRFRLAEESEAPKKKGFFKRKEKTKGKPVKAKTKERRGPKPRVPFDDVPKP